MLHILLMILKIIGIVLLVILGLLLLIILSVLFVPVRYRAKGYKQEKEIQGQVGVSWLLHLVSVKVLYADGDINFIIRLLGIDLQKAKNFFEGRKNKKPEKKVAEEKLVPDKEEHEQTISSSEDDTPDIQLVIQEKTNTQNTTQESKQPVDIVAPKAEHKKSLPEWIISMIRRIYHLCTDIIKKIVAIPKRIWAFCKKTALTIRTICAKISQWKLFLTDEKTKAALLHIRHEIVLILKHIRPRKLKGNVEFGLEDPYETGQILAGLGMFYALYGNHIQVNPQFDRSVLNGDVDLKGRIYVFVLLRIAWHVYKDKNVKFVIKNFQHKEE